MKTKIKVNEIFNISEKIIFTVTVIEGNKYLIGDTFYNQELSLKFELKGIAMENQPQSSDKSFLVLPLEGYDSLQDFKGKCFIINDL